MNKINLFKINTVAKEINSKKGALKETAQEIKTQAANLARDLVRNTETNPNITVSELVSQGYTIGKRDIIYKVDFKKDIYNAVQFDKKGIKNITISGAIINGDAIVVTQRMGDKWVSIVKGKNIKCNTLENTSERAAREVTELQYNGYSIAAQDEKSLTLIKDDAAINISKINGKEIKCKGATFCTEI